MSVLNQFEWNENTAAVCDDVCDDGWVLCPFFRLIIDEMIGVADDLQRAWDPSYNVGRFPHRYGYDRKDDNVIIKIRTQFFSDDFPRFMGYLTDQLKRNNGGFIAGQNVTIADCRLLPQLNYFQRAVGEHLPEHALDAYPEVVAYLERLRKVPAISSWPFQHGSPVDH